MIPDQITRTVYIGECSRSMGISEKVLTLQVAKELADRAEREAAEALRRRNREAAGLPSEPDDSVPSDTQSPDRPATSSPSIRQAGADPRARYLEPYEQDLVRYVVKYGMAIMCEYHDSDDNLIPMSVIEYIDHELRADEITLANESMRTTFEQALEIAYGPANEDIRKQAEMIEERVARQVAEGIEEIARTTDDMTMIERREKDLVERINAHKNEEIAAMRATYISSRLLSSIDDNVRRIATELVTDRHHLSKIHTKYSKIQTEQDRLMELVPISVYNLKSALIECDLQDINNQIKQIYAAGDMETVRQLMIRATELNTIKKELAKYLGERILSSRKR